MVPAGLSAPAGDRLRAALSSPLAVTRTNVPLRVSLARLAAVTGVPIVLDRHVDPTTPDSTDAPDGPAMPAGQGPADAVPGGAAGPPAARPLWSTLAATAERHGLTATLVGDVVWIGPSDPALILGETLAARRREAGRLPADVRSRLTRSESLAWPAVAAPADVFRAWCDRHEVRCDQSLPPDLWPATTLPAVDFAAGATLILAQFGQTFRFGPDGRTIELVDLPPPGPTAAERHAALLTGRWSDPTWRQVVAGRPVEPATGPPPRRDVASIREKLSRNRHVLRQTSVPPRALLAALAAQIGLPITVDPAAESALATRIDVDARGLPTEALLESILTPLGLTFDLSADGITVRPR